jgi:UDP-2,4-diacetamido-2,4,6-trideoxy-beta-L-altropyranose hydrolase
MLPVAAPGSEPEARVDATLFDVAAPQLFPQAEAVAPFIRRVRERSSYIAFLDGFGPHGLSARATLDVDLVVMPYVGVDANAVRGAPVLAGPGFAVLPPPYATLPMRGVRRAAADRLLITCGGSDPAARSLEILAATETLDRPLRIRVVVGPLFDPVLRCRLLRAAAESRHAVELVDAPEALAAQIRWSDLVLTLGGLTKYETAAAGVPVLILAAEGTDWIVNEAFAAAGAAVCLPAGTDAGTLASAIAALLDDAGARARLADAGRALVDGRGGERILMEISGRCRAA